MRYFQIQCGLRGCYMPDSAYSIAVATRRELKEIVASEAANISGHEGRVYGLGKRDIASSVALAWRNYTKAGNYLPVALPYREAWRSDYSSALFIAPLSRSEYLECVENEER